MKNSSHKEDRKRYVFFTDPDVVAKRAEISAVAAQKQALTQDLRVQTLKRDLPYLDIQPLNIKSLFVCPGYSYPFPFISAVKQKLALKDHDTSVSTHDPNSVVKSNLASSIIEQEMDIRPLKIPDVKITSKTLEFSSRENTVSKEFQTKSEISTKEILYNRSDKTSKTGERVQRKLDFVIAGSSVINSEIEPLKAPNVSIASNLSKKKEHGRDREKENRSKRIKKDDFLCSKRDESVQDQVKRSRSPRHVSRKDTADTSDIRLLKNDRLIYTSKSDLITSKDKNFVTSTIKKDSDKRERQRSFNVQSVDSVKEYVSAGKARISGNYNETSTFPSWKMSEEVTLSDNKVSSSVNTENKLKDICNLKKLEIEDSKYKSELDSKQLKQDKIITHKEQTKRICDKNKMSNTSKLEGKRSMNLDESLEDIDSTSEITNSFKNCANAYPVSFIRHSKSTDSETFAESDLNNPARLAKTSENHTYSEHLNMTQVETVNESHTGKDKESYSESVLTKKATTNDDSNDMDVSTLPDSLFDSRRISFRDGYTQQEFHNLTVPEKMTLEPRFKRRSNCIESNDLEIDTRCPKYKLSHIKSEREQEGIQLTELHLYDSHVESLRQIMDVEKHLYNATCEQEQKLQKISEKDEELKKKTAEGGASLVIDKEDVEENLPSNSLDYMKKDVEIRKPNDEGNVDESYKTYGKFNKAVAEIQTQTVNDMATQTDLFLNERNAENRLSKIHEKVYEQLLTGNQVPQLSLDSTKYETLDQVEDDISLPKIKNVMSEFSILHETTSSKKTETGTEIVSRDVTCSFSELSIENQYSEIAQCLNENERLIKHEKERCTKFEEIYKAYMEIAYDKQKKIQQLEDQKRALKNRGQDSRPLKKKQRALLMKLIRGTNYAERIKAAVNIIKKRTVLLQRERILLSQSQDMSTKNHILTKLKRSADNQSPRKLSGPMKGYDIRSNSSLSSVIDSDKSLHDQSQGDARLKTLGSDMHSKLDSIKSNVSTRLAKDSNTRCDESKELQKSLAKSQKKSDVLKYELRSRKYEEKMPGANVLRQKQNQLNVKSKRYQEHSMKQLLGSQESLMMSPRPELDALDVKSESDVLEELSRILQTEETATISREKNKNLTSNSNANSKSIEEQINTTLQDTNTKTTKSPQISEDLLQTISSQSSKKSDKSIVSDRDISKKPQHSTELKTNSKRKSSNYQKTKSSSSTLTENVLRSISSSYIFEELLNHHDKRAKLKNESSQLDSNNESLILDEPERKHSEVVKNKASASECETKESIISKQAFNRNVENNVENPSKNEQGIHVSTSFTISHSESETSFSKSIRLELRKKSENKDFEQILAEREVALTSRKKCVENYMARHARLKAEEDRVTRMEQAAYYKLVAEAVLQERLLRSIVDTTMSSDMSDIEGRITALTEEVAKRRSEIARLKKEARKRTKKQLLDMETNLLNKIKIYDASIHKMRKKLESKKSFKETDKLAIEPKSLADYKVPEIPHIKKIEDIYKKNDLLRSRSESDLLSMRNQPKNLKLASLLTRDDRDERESSSKNSVNTTDITASKSRNITDNTHNIQTTLDDHTSIGIHNKVHTPIFKPSPMNNSQFGKHAQKSVIASRDAKDIQKNSNTELEVRTISDAKSGHQNTISTDNEPIASINKSEQKTPPIESNIQEIKSVDYSTSISHKSNSSTKNVAHATIDFNTLSFSRKLDFLQLNNKNLNENISSLENNMREIMSRLSKESNEKSKADNDDRNTSQDISEIISKSVFSDKISNIANEEKQTISHETKINTKLLATSVNDENLKLSKDLSYNVTDKINDEISAIIPEEATSLSNSIHEIDYEAKSKEIMNEIEKSIISEHLETAHSDNYSATSEGENKESLNDLFSKLDVKSISEIFSKKSKRSDITTEIVDNAKKDMGEEEKEQEKTKENHSAEIYLSRTLSERFSTKSLHSPIISGHRSKKAYGTFDDNSRSTRSIVSSQLSRNVASDASELSEYIFEVPKDVNSLASNTDQSQLRTITPGDVSQDNNDWTTSDSFEVAQNEEKELKNSQDSRSVTEHTDDSSNNTSERDVHVDDKKAKSKLASEANVSAFISKEASIDVEVHNATFTNTAVESHTIKNNDELDDILDIIAREDNQIENISNDKKFSISDSITELLEKVEDIAKNDEKSAESDLEEILCDMNINVNNQLETVSDTSMLKREEEEDTNENNVILQSIANKSKREEATDNWLEIETDDKHDKEESPREAMSEVQEIIITELDSDSIKDNALSEVEIDAKVELAEEEETDENHGCAMKESKKVFVEIQECLEPFLEQDSSDGEQLDNLVEVAESGLDTLEKYVTPSRDSLKSIKNDAALVQVEDNVDPINNKIATPEEAKVTENLNKTFDILKDPEYEDISEESLEVSEILDKHLDNSSNIAKKSTSLPERYEATQKSDEVLRILDQLSQKSSLESTSNSRKSEKNVTEDINELLRRVSVEDDNLSLETRKKTQEESRKMDESRDRFQEETKQVKLSMETSDVGLFENKSAALSKLAEHDANDKSSRIMYELREKVAQLQEQDDSSDSSEAGDTPRGVSEIEMDSPRDLNDSRLNIDILDNDLLSGTKGASQNDMKTNFHSASIVATSEKDIETMIDKLKASLEQPGLEVAELEAKLLRIEQLQIELEIKKLEAEEVSYYVREIPNKPPPPYTPPGDGRLLTSLELVPPVTSVIPSNIEELTAFTVRAATLIYAAKLAGEDIASLEVPAEIHELTNDENESVARDRRIYNTFLFNLCKEITVEVYRAEYEKPGPSWTKPNVKTKPIMKIPKSEEELIKYVNKEVATLFGFKAKLQRENMVMRWSRKRRDRVDELLAREAQAEEDEWTKFHHDELAVKNSLTVAILDTLLMETVNVVKSAYGKKRRRMMI